LFKLQTKTDILHVPYRGAGPAMQDLVAGHVDMMFDGLGTSANQIAGGQLRGLALAAEKRVAAIGNVPTSAEAGLPTFVMSTWYAIWAPKGTPPDVIARMSKELRTAMATTVIKDSWARNGSEIPDMTGADFGKFVHSEIARWGSVVKEAGVKLE
jgi:tripartite-type tricarboxylate transporter receptor subunit TctC